MFIAEINFRGAEIDIITLGACIYILDDFCFNSLFLICHKFFSKKAASSQEDLFLSCQEPARVKPRLLRMISEKLSEYQPKRIHSFQEIFVSHKEIFKPSFSETLSDLRVPVNRQSRDWRKHL